MEQYVTPTLQIYLLDGCDVVTVSDPNDNNWSDIENWE